LSSLRTRLWKSCSTTMTLGSASDTFVLCISTSFHHRPYTSHSMYPVIRAWKCCVRHITNYFPRHPFHLHGHAFQVVTRSEDDAGFYDPTNTTTPPSTPMRRDTVLVRPNGHTVLRFRSDNPGKSSSLYSLILFLRLLSPVLDIYKIASIRHVTAASY
jgi:hypothetical protein